MNETQCPQFSSIPGYISNIPLGTIIAERNVRNCVMPEFDFRKIIKLRIAKLQHSSLVDRI